MTASRNMVCISLLFLDSFCVLSFSGSSFLQYDFFFLLLPFIISIKKIIINSSTQFNSVLVLFIFLFLFFFSVNWVVSFSDDGALYFDDKLVDGHEYRGPLSTTSSVLGGLTAFAAVTAENLNVRRMSSIIIHFSPIIYSSWTVF